jgi:hypothetical protein
LTLGAAGSYLGGTVVEAGTLLISDVGAAASVLGSGPLSVESTGTLGGSGLILGNTTLAGTLAPGNSPGALHFGGNLLMTSTATARLELSSLATFDTIKVDGTMTYDGTLRISFLDAFSPLGGNTFQLFDAPNVFGGSTFDQIQFDAAGYAGAFDYGTGTLSITAIPEPSTCAALAGALTLGVAAWRKRRHA